MVEVGLDEVKTYISRRQNTVPQFIATRPFLNLGLEAFQRPGSRVSKQWCEPDGMDVGGIPKESWEAERTEVGEDTYGTDTEID